MDNFKKKYFKYKYKYLELQKLQIGSGDEDKDGPETFFLYVLLPKQYNDAWTKRYKKNILDKMPTNVKDVYIEYYDNSNEGNIIDKNKYKNKDKKINVYEKFNNADFNFVDDETDANAEINKDVIGYNYLIIDFSNRFEYCEPTTTDPKTNIVKDIKTSIEYKLCVFIPYMDISSYSMTISSTTNSFYKPAILLEGIIWDTNKMCMMTWGEKLKETTYFVNNSKYSDIEDFFDNKMANINQIHKGYDQYFKSIALVEMIIKDAIIDINDKTYLNRLQILQNPPTITITTSISTEKKNKKKKETKQKGSQKR